MRIGTMFLGEVEALAGQSIQTKFFIFGLPLVPLTSYFVTTDRGTSVQGIEIPIHGKSVFFGYLRCGLFLSAMLWGVIAWVTKRYGDGLGILVGPALLTVAWALATFVFGKMPKSERRHRLTLHRITGLAAAPALLPQEARQGVLRKLREAWNAKSNGRDWRTAAPALTLDHAELLFTLANYEGDTILADQIWAKILEADGQ